MQKPSEAKRRTIIETAAALFAEKPFPEVRLDDVALGARVGKGTLYVYFSSKEDLFDELLVHSFEQMLERLRPCTDGGCGTAWGALEKAVRELSHWASTSPHFRMINRHQEGAPPTPRLRARRREFGKIIEGILRRGIEAGEFQDDHPELTAQFIPGCVRGALRHGPDALDEGLVADHILAILDAWLRHRKRAGA